ncbi:MAG: hypothetical protein GF388_11660 [Candidatus Aegiribacteria sp.]|nr:hypothetical protein [Candidatus Aegiribacteria sp.]MBD3295637.1 hypothetical protein [Candidatus Fermentibacteria bacterium]
MAHFSSLASRVAVAIPGIGVFVAVALVNNDILTASVFFIVAFTAGMEALRLTDGESGLSMRLLSGLLAGGASLSVMFLSTTVSMVTILMPGILLSAVWIMKEEVGSARMRMGGITALTVLIALGTGLLARLRMDYDSGWVFFIPLFSCWAGDSFAYFAGSAFGRHKMAPRVSPAKSWEGLAAGLTGSVAGSLAAGSAGAGYSMLSMGAVGLFAGVAGILGDLMESAMKRDAGVKDSGAILPGHGGILDRFDSLLLSAPAVWLMLILISEFGVL